MNSLKDIISGHSHSFDIGIARRFGLDAAVVFNHILYWLSINANKKEAKLIDGKYWMYETQQQIADFLGYLSYDQVKRAIKILLDNGLLIKGNFNQTAFDKTAWYTVEDQDFILIKKSFSKAQICAIDSVPVRDRQRAGARSINNVQEDKQEDKQQQHEPANAVVVDVDFLFTDEEREQLNNYSSEQIEEAMETTNRECVQKKNESRIKFLFKVLEGLKIKPNIKTKQQDQGNHTREEKNRIEAKETLKNWMRPKNVKVEFFSNYLEIDCSQGSASGSYQPKILSYNEFGFMEQFENALRKCGCKRKNE